MNKFKIALLLLTGSIAFAQDNEDASGKPYNRWSVEAYAGQNKPVRPFAEGYYSSQPQKYFFFSDISHFSLGFRYMLSPKFGLRFDGSYDKFASESGSGSLPFESKLYRLNFQGVANFGRILNFESFTGRLGLLAHAGVQVSTFESQNQAIGDKEEDNGGLIIGITPQLRLSNRLVFSADLSAVQNLRQHLNWDGTNAADSNNLTGMFYNISVGLTFYLGGKDVHADWYIENSKAAEDTDARNRLDELEAKLNDTDRDGIPDFLDAENNTPSGVAVDSKGRFIDKNKNNVPDEMEGSRESYFNTSDKTIAGANDKEVVKNLLASGMYTVFYDPSKDVPNSGSTNSVYQLVNYFRANPSLKIKLTGYADVTGDPKANQQLSERRAAKLRDFFIDSGIEAGRIEVAASGADNSFASQGLGYRVARRVTVEIVN